MKNFNMKRVTYTYLLALILLFSFSKTIAQFSVIGNPIKIGNLQVAQYDFRKIPWVDANNSCINLGDGWRLPTIEELKILYQNRESIGNFKWDSYWSSTKGNVVIAWRLNFGDGMVYDRDNTDNTACVRAVKTLPKQTEKGKVVDKSGPNDLANKLLNGSGNAKNNNFIPSETSNSTRKYCISNSVGKYEISLLEGGSNKAYFKLYNGSGALQKTMQGNWVLRDEGVYGSAYKLTISWTGPNAGMADLKFNCQYDGSGLLQALFDPQGRTWNSCN